MVLRVQKTLSPNDMGDTKSHQAGVHVPKQLVYFFPTLNESTLNPRSNLRLQNEHGVIGTCTYIHHNNKIVGDGTRDEYRVTRIRRLLSECGARTGDTIELNRIGDDQYLIRILASDTGPMPGTVVVNLARGWRTVRA